MYQEKLIRSTDDIIIMLTDEEEFFRKKFVLQSLDLTEWKCTICAKITTDKHYPHPALRVSICFNCLKSYGNAVFLTNRDGTDKNCRWCAQPANKYCCASCTVVFCKNCLEHNFGLDFIRKRLTGVSDWNCFICDPKPLWRLRVECSKAMEKSTNNNEETSEIIDLLSQESQKDQISQLALANNSEQFCSEVISPKKPLQPIVDSDENDSLWLTQQPANDNNKSTDQDLTSDDKNSVLEVFKEAENYMNDFLQLFSTRLDQYSRKVKNLDSYQRAEKLNYCVSKLCDDAIENIQCLKNNTRVKYGQWSKSVSEPKRTNCDTKSVPNNNCINTESKSIVSSSKAVQKITPESKINEPSTSKNSKPSQAKRKYSRLSLNSSRTELPKDDTIAFLEEIKKIIPDDQISPSKHSLSLLNHDKNTSPKTPEILSPPISPLEVNKTENKTENIPENKTENNCSEISITPIRRNIAKKKTASSQRPTKPTESLFEEEIVSVNIKTEKTESEHNSRHSEETIIRNSSSDSKLKKEELADGEEELMTRIREDFDEDSNNVCVRIETYLCDKTGTFCCNYRTGNDAISEDSSPPFDFSEKESVSSERSDDTEDVDWGDLIDLTRIAEPREIQEIDLTRDIQFGEIDLLENNLKDELKHEPKYEELSSVIKEEELAKEDTVSESSAQLKHKELSPGRSPDIKEDTYSSGSDSDSDSSEARAAALKSLANGMSDISSSSSASVSSESDSDSSSQEETQRPRIPWEPSGHVQELNIEDERAKLQENYNELEKSYTTADFENSQDPQSQDPKLDMEPVVELDKDYKLSLTPVVRLEKINFDNCYGLVKNGKKYSISNSDDSEDEIKRLTDLSSLKKRNFISTTTDTDSDAESCLIRKKKRFTKHKIVSSSSSSNDGSDNDSDDSSMSYKTAKSNILNTTQRDEDYVPEISDDILNDNDTLTEETTEDEEVVEVKDKKNTKNKSDVEEITDEDEPEKSSQEEDPKASWRKDRLLTGNLTLGNSDSETNDSTANAILKEQYEKYVQNADNEKPPKKRRDSVQSIDSSTSNTIVLSTDGDSDDSDIQFVDLKRKRDSDDEGSPRKNKKGRRNIREVLKDSELHEETKKADKEETERKERLSLKQKTLESLLFETQLSQEEIGFVLEMDEEKKEPIVTVHHTLVPPLKDHQKKGIKFMWDVCFESAAQTQSNKGVGCILAHCMGLGKTMQVVVLAHTLLTHPKVNIKRILVVCPLSTVFNWRNEFEKTLKPCLKKIQLFDIRPHKQKTFNQKMFEVKRWKDQGGVLMMGYESFQSLVNEDKLSKIDEKYKEIMIETLIDPGPDVVVCDEGHMLKNGKTLRFISLSKVKTSRRIILTGTPLQNNLLEYYHMVNFVKPHLLGTLDEYKNRFVHPIMNGQYEDSNQRDINLMKKRSHILHKKLETTVQRYEESELAPYLPERHDYVLFFQLTPIQILLYEHYLTLLDASTRKLFKNYHALQNIWTHPALLKIKYENRRNPPSKQQRRYDEDYVEGWDPDREVVDALDTDWFTNILPRDVLDNMSYGMKIEALFSVIKECEAIKEKLLVFSSSIDELDLIEYFLKRQNWLKTFDYYRMDGSVPPERRSFYCNEFNNENNPRARLFLVSHKVGGLGLNLTAATRVVLMDVNWNPAYDTQSVFRVYRFGQTKNCYIYRFVSLGTMEEVVYSRAVTKLAISCRVVDEHQIKRHFNADDLQRMYSLIKDFGEPHTPTLPSDRLLAKLWETHKPKLFKFCDHQSLLVNLEHEELNEEEMNLAWEEFRNEVEEEKKSKELAAQMRSQINYNPTNVALPMGPNMTATPNRFPQLPRVPNIKPVDQLPPDHRYKRPNPQPGVPIPTTTNYQQTAQFLRRIGYYNMNNPPNTSSNPMPSTSTAPTPNLPNLQSLLTSFNSKFNANPTYVSSTQNATPLNLSNTTNSNDSNNLQPNPFSGNLRKGEAIIRNLNVPTVKIAPKTTPNKENIFRRTIDTLNSNGVSVLPEDKTQN